MFWGFFVFGSFLQVFFFLHCKGINTTPCCRTRKYLVCCQSQTYSGPSELLSIKSSNNHEYLNNAIRVTLTVFAFRLYLMQADCAVRSTAGLVSAVGMLAPAWAPTLIGAIRIVASDHHCCLIVCRHQHTGCGGDVIR